MARKPTLDSMWRANPAERSLRLGDRNRTAKQVAKKSEREALAWAKRVADQERAKEGEDDE